MNLFLIAFIVFTRKLQAQTEKEMAYKHTRRAALIDANWGIKAVATTSSLVLRETTDQESCHRVRGGTLSLTRGSGNSARAVIPDKLVAQTHIVVRFFSMRNNCASNSKLRRKLCIKLVITSTERAFT